MNVLEHVIMAIAPSWGASRARSRYLARQFTGADFDRLRGRLSYGSSGPVEENRRARQPMICVARDLDRNNSWAHGAFNSIVNNIVGSGIRLEAQIRTAGGKLLSKANDACEDQWDQWSSGCDLTGSVSFHDFQRMVERELWVAGEVLVAKVVPTDNRPIPLALEVIESERLWAYDRDEGQNRIIQGVEYTPSGAVAAYWIHPEHPADSLAVKDLQRVPASRVLHIFHPERPGQVRGLSPVASVARNFEALGQFMDHELTRARVASAFALMIRRGGSSLAPKFPTQGLSTTEYDSNGSVVDDRGNPLAHLEGGMIFYGGPNDSIEGTGPSIQNSPFEQFITVNLRAIATGLGISYELLARDYTKCNFSSARQSTLEDRKHWEPRQQFLIRRLCSPVFGWFSELAFMAGVPPFAGRAKQIEVDWITRQREYVDPTKEIQADILAVQHGFTTYTKIAAKHGTDAHENIRQNAQLVKEAEEAGFPLLGVSAPPEPEPEDETDASVEDNSDDAGD
jgi:lambda family phage portal protein